MQFLFCFWKNQHLEVPRNFHISWSAKYYMPWLLSNLIPFSFNPFQCWKPFLPVWQILKIQIGWHIHAIKPGSTEFASEKQKTIRIHHECSWKIEISRPRVRNSKKGRGSAEAFLEFLIARARYFYPPWTDEWWIFFLPPNIDYEL